MKVHDYMKVVLACCKLEVPNLMCVAAFGFDAAVENMMVIGSNSATRNVLVVERKLGGSYRETGWLQRSFLDI